MDTSKIVFGGGCFWCTEAVFKMLHGVMSVAPGYAGGPSTSLGQAPTYEEVCSGNTGHAEVVQIEYNQKLISLNDLLTVFFATHDPTTKNRQGNDVGEEYRSIILYENNEQKEASEKFITELNNSSPEGKPIVTEVKPLEKFYPAEDYHKDFYDKNKNKAYCIVNINPKLKKVKEQFANLLKERVLEKI